MEHQPTEISIDTSAAEEVQTIPVISQLSILAALLFLVFGVGVMPHLLPEAENDNQAATVMQTPVAKDDNETDHFADLTITGNSGFVFDVATQTMLWSKNPDEQLPLASVTKLMTALVAYELMTADTDIKITEAALNQDGASGLREGELFTLQDISDLLLLTSSNDGAYAVAETVGQALDSERPADAFVQAMNIRAEELGLTQTFFRNPTGLDTGENDAGAYGSARDMVILMQHILKQAPDILPATRSQSRTLVSESGFTHTNFNTNPYTENIPGLIGSKTGYTELAGGNLVVAFNAGADRPVIAVSLGSTRQARFSDIEKIVTATLQQVQ